jgi:hypothetical protein
VVSRPGELDVAAAAFVHPAQLYSRLEALAGSSPVPAAAGFYGWWFRRLPPLVHAGACAWHDGLALSGRQAAVRIGRF